MERDDLVRLFAALAAEDVAAVRRALRSLYADPDVEGIRAEDLAGDFPVVRYVPPDGGPVLDLIARLGDLRSEVRDLGGVPVRLATPATLYAMKHDTVRPVDRADAERLRDAFGLGSDA